MKKIELKVGFHCPRCKTQVLKSVAKLEGIDQVSMDGAKGTLIVIGDVDPVLVTIQIRKTGKEAEIISVGPKQNPDNVGSRFLRRWTRDDLGHWWRINHVCFSADGEWLLFTVNLGGVTAELVSVPNQFQPYADLYVVKLDGSGLRRLTWNGYQNGTPSWHQGQNLNLNLNRTWGVWAWGAMS